MTYRFKLTKQRKIILDTLNKSKHLVTAEELYEEVKKNYEKINLSTVYRNLELLIKEQLLVKHILQDGITRYEFKEKQNQHHHHLICTECDQIIPLKQCPLYIQSDLQKDLKEQGFEVTGHQFEVYGICKSCKERNK